MKVRNGFRVPVITSSQFFFSIQNITPQLSKLEAQKYFEEVDKRMKELMDNDREVVIEKREDLATQRGRLLKVHFYFLEFELKKKFELNNQKKKK